MQFVDPIRDVEKIYLIKKNLRETSLRDLLLFVIGINTGVGVSDLLNLTVDDVWDGESVREFLYLKEKNDEVKVYFINDRVKEVLVEYIQEFVLHSEDYLFKSKKDNLPITRQQAYRIINHAAREAGITGKVGTHTLRKTFGYHAYRKGVAISILRSIFNHHSSSETLHYIGIDKKEHSLIRVDVNL